MANAFADNFEETLFIGIGADTHFFTLRETYLHHFVVHGENHWTVRSFHHCNLSTDAAEAVEKAREYSHKYGVPLKTNPETLAKEMLDIKRKNAEERAAAREKEIEDAARRAEWEAEREEKINAMLAENKIPFGKYYNYPFDAIPRGYLRWLASNINEFDEGSLIHRTAKKVIEIYGENAGIPVPTPGVVIDEPKARKDFDVTVIRATGFNSDWGWVNVVSMVDKATGALLVAKGRFSAKIGDELSIKATIKKVGEYNGEKNTIINRVKVA